MIDSLPFIIYTQNLEILIINIWTQSKRARFTKSKKSLTRKSSMGRRSTLSNGWTFLFRRPLGSVLRFWKMSRIKSRSLKTAESQQACLIMTIMTQILMLALWEMISKKPEAVQKNFLEMMIEESKDKRLMFPNLKLSRTNQKSKKKENEGALKKKKAWSIMEKVKSLSKYHMSNKKVQLTRRKKSKTKNYSSRAYSLSPNTNQSLETWVH